MGAQRPPVPFWPAHQGGAAGGQRGPTQRPSGGELEEEDSIVARTRQGATAKIHGARKVPRHRHTAIEVVHRDPQAALVPPPPQTLAPHLAPPPPPPRPQNN